MTIKKTFPIIIVFLLWNIPFFFKEVIFDRNAMVEFLSIEAVLFVFFTFISIKFDIHLRFLFLLSMLSVAASILVSISGFLYLAPFYLVSALVAMKPALHERKRDDIAVALVSSLIFLALLLISTSLRILPVNTVQHHIFLFSIYNNAPAVGVPITYAFGLVISLGKVTLTVSPLILIVFPAVAYLASSNTFLIIRSPTPGTSVASAAVTALACQCENTVGILSGTASYLAFAIVPYLVFFSVVMLVVTNLFLHKPRPLPKLNFGVGLFLLLFLVSMVAESALIFSGLVFNLWIFGLNSTLTLFSGFFLGQIVPFRHREPLPLIGIAFSLQLMLLIPFVIGKALVSPLYFEIYSLLGIVSGLLISLAMRNRRKISKIGIIELVFSMEAMLSVIFLYLSLNSVVFFPGYSQVAVLSFSLFLLFVSIPVMWFSNIFLLSARFFGT
ncbi:MAG: hypothetical protein QXN66_06025 [Thermoplasmatales archaeon]